MILTALLTILMHIGPNAVGAAWSIHQNGFHLDGLPARHAVIKNERLPRFKIERAAPITRGLRR